jgi:hypothetical protein
MILFVVFDLKTKQTKHKKIDLFPIFLMSVVDSQLLYNNKKKKVLLKNIPKLNKNKRKINKNSLI